MISFASTYRKWLRMYSFSSVARYGTLLAMSNAAYHLIFPDAEAGPRGGDVLLMENGGADLYDY